MLHRIRRFIAHAVVAFGGFAAFSFALPAEAGAVLQYGDIVRGPTQSTLYYYGADGMRYVFPNEKTYFSWYTDYTHVRTLTEDDLARLQIGGNVTYKPGTRLLKIDTDPRVYLVTEGGVLRWVETEGIAASLYGGGWATYVDDLPDPFFANYSLGDSIRTPDDIRLDEVLQGTHDINDDKDISIPAVIKITSQGYSPIDVIITKGQSVQFVNGDTSRHTVTSDTLLWGSGTLAPGEEFVHTFGTEGTYSFFDSYNSRNTGAIYVLPSTE